MKNFYEKKCNLPTERRHRFQQNWYWCHSENYNHSSVFFDSTKLNRTTTKIFIFSFQVKVIHI